MGGFFLSSAKDCLIAVLAFLRSSGASSSKGVREAASRDLSGSVGSNVPHCAASIAFGAICVAFVVTVPGSFTTKIYGLFNQFRFKAKLPPECLVSKADFFFSSGEQESTWLH